MSWQRVATSQTAIRSVSALMGVAFRDSSSHRLRILDAFTLQDVRSFPAPTGQVVFFAPDGTIGLDAGSELGVYDSLRGIELKARRQSTP